MMSSVPTERRRSRKLDVTSPADKKRPAEYPSAGGPDTLRAHIAHLERQLVRAEKLSALGLLACGVAHEISNPMMGVKACVHALRNGNLDETQREAYFDTISDALARIEQTVHNLLHFGRERPAVRTPVDLTQVVLPSLRLLRSMLGDKNLVVDDNVRPNTARVVGDPSELAQALVNVLINAAHASPAMGHITIDAVRESGRIGLRVTDQGPGIPPQLRNQVCEPFFTTKPEDQGTGLGLAVTQTIARRHGGSLQIENSEAGGAQVTIWLGSATC